MKVFHNAAMRKRSRIALALLLLAVIGGIAWLTLRTSEPMYKGKPLSFWLGAYSAMHTLNLHDGQEKWGESNEAVRSIGTNAIPILLRRLRVDYSPLTLRLLALAQKQHLFKVRSPSENQREGILGFEALGDHGKVVVPELIRIYEKDSSFRSRYSTIVALGCIGPAAEQAVPMLVQSLGDTKSYLRPTALFTLGQIHSRPEIAVPALIKCLGDRDFSVKMTAAGAITGFGSDARQAVPALLNALEDSDAYVKAAARSALKEIDPEAAAKAGVK
ncbi:MAG: repeat-containing protein [Pedosphaera sp.]|nr:repeat-containing protein [Pedosphaera sp.]